MFVMAAVFFIFITGLVGAAALLLFALLISEDDKRSSTNLYPHDYSIFLPKSKQR